MNKQQIREIIKEKRKNSDLKILQIWNLSIKKNLESLLEYQKAETIFFYVSFGREVDTMNLIEEALIKGKKIIVPYYDGENYSLSYLENIKNLKKGRLSILEPKKESIIEADVALIDFIVVPGLAFDKKMNRVGYGEGNYDNFMKNTKAVKAALCYEFQIFDEVPHNKNDVALDMIITEKKVYRITNRGY
jgi:5-formyltetrahydrofolate cyclo-ligase